MNTGGSLSFEDIELQVGYAGRGREILNKFVLPALQMSVRYDRITSYFSLGSLLAVAQGIEQLFRRGGRMRLVVGLHDFPREMAAAAANVEALDAQIQQVRLRVVEEAARLQDELAARRLATLAWMLVDGLLEVKVAWLPGVPADSGGIFHSKSYVMEDAFGNVVAANGSQNETVMGLGDNWEKLSVFASWKASREHALYEVEEFERIWRGQDSDLIIRELDVRFARELLEVLPESANVEARPTAKRIVAGDGTLREFMRRAARVPGLMSLQGPAALFPHQESACMDSLARWPFRVMLADEVGLGKTFEAGSVIRYALQGNHAKTVLILAPKAVVQQWQAELREHFGLDFWIFDSGSQAYLSPDNAVQLKPSRVPVLNPDAPELLIVSSQYARGMGSRPDVFEQSECLPDMLVVDEAHAARLTVDSAGKQRFSKLYRTLRAVADKIPHLVLATATPLQLDWHEYHGLLDLLGLPPLWRVPEQYWDSLSILAGLSSKSLQAAATAAVLIRDAIAWFGIPRDRFDGVEAVLYDRIVGAEPLVHLAAGAFAEWDATLNMLVRIHPGGLLTVRNTRSVLSRMGYEFPERNLVAPEMPTSSAIDALYSGIDVYLAQEYYSIERALHPERSFSPGFVRSSYQQRLASTLSACRLTLERRLLRAEALRDGWPSALDTLDQLEDSAELDSAADWESEATNEETPSPAAAVARAASIECAYLQDLIKLCDKAIDEGDPKIRAVVDIANGLQAGQAVLVFSRFTDSLDACIQAFRAASSASLGCFTGDEIWIDAGDGPVPSSRRGIRDALATGTIRVVFCSDAASEGVNLQSADVLVNVDVPWNPAKLEQRIGRIARLGQAAPIVTIHNLWYPGSVEGRIYGRLMARRELFELAVGEFPEIIAQAIQEQCVDPTLPSWSTAADRLQAARRDEQFSAMSRVWSFDGVDRKSVTTSLREELCDVVQESRLADGVPGEPLPATGPGADAVMSLSDGSLLALTPRATSADQKVASVGFLRSCDKDVAVALDFEGAQWIVGVDELPRLLSAIVLLKPFRIESCVRLQVGEERATLRDLSRLTSWPAECTGLRTSESYRQAWTTELTFDRLSHLDATVAI